jgi:hypothetical protein
MGMLDHRRTWRYDVKASPNQCMEAFARAFSGPGGLVTKAKWGVKRTSKGAVAVYEGRKGLGALGGIMSKTAALEQDTALGSEVQFEVDENHDGRTVCTMWLGSSGRAGIAGIVGVTSDARFIRPYMQAVQKEMLALDPSAQISTGR